MGTTGQNSAETLAELVDRATRRQPNAVALRGLGGDIYSWAEVDRVTQQLAHTLVARGVVQGARVAVACPKSELSFLAVHAVLRAGGVVVPIDSLAPAPTARRVLAHAGVTAMIGDAPTVAKIDPWSIDGVSVGPVVVSGEFSDERMMPWDAALSSAPAVELPQVRPDSPAYLIFTSGSTGTPKGILHTHGSGVRYAQLAVETHALSTTDRIAAMCPIHFDMSTLELYAAPLAGATVVSMGEAHLRFPASLVERCAVERVTIWYAVPFQLRSMVERGALDQRDLSSLRTVVYAGEPYPAGPLAELMTALPDVEVINAYGPAEVNVCTTHAVTEIPRPDDSIPIGRPWGDARGRVVDERGQKVPDGEMGELWISTDTMMLGYWGEPEMTEAVIVSDGDRNWYRTGDLVTADRDGTLHFHGRRDHQVKVRGTRLELQAIEDLIASHDDVADAVVAPIGDDGPAGSATHLVAAVVMQPGATFDERALRRWCGSRLVAVAVPAGITCRMDLPTTSSGKVDRGAVRRELHSIGDRAPNATHDSPEARSDQLSSAGGHH